MELTLQQIEQIIASKYDRTHTRKWQDLSDDQRASYYNKQYKKVVAGHTVKKVKIGKLSKTNLRLVFDNVDGEEKDITLPMEKWIVDWWFECNFVPENDAIIKVAELDGVSILDELESVDGEKIFLSVTDYFQWKDFYNQFMHSLVDKNMENSSAFINWLSDNYLFV